MEYLPPVGWNDVARRHDLDLLRAEMHTALADIRTELHKGFNRMLIWLVSTIVASVGIVLAVVGTLH